jgi:hypothetical protein
MLISDMHATLTRDGRRISQGELICQPVIAA